MAACHPKDGDSSDPDKINSSCLSHPVKQPAGGREGNATTSSATSEDIKLKGDKAYEEVANYNEEALRSFLEEVTNAGKTKDKSSLSPHALALLRREEDALREESSSGDDTRELFERCRNKKFLGRHRHSRHHPNPSHHSHKESSAAARSSTGGSLGSLQDLSDTKQVKQTSGAQNQGVAARCREGGSCGNLSRGSFETQPPSSRRKGGGGRRGAREAANAANRASASQREGGSLQNLSKSEGGGGESKKLHKSGSLSQVCSEPTTGARSKNRRQKTASESSGRHETASCITASTPTATASDSRATFPPEGVGGRPLGGIASPDSGNNDDSMSDGETTEEEAEAVRGGALIERCGGNESAALEESGIELQTVTCHRADHDTTTTTSRHHHHHHHHHDNTTAIPVAVAEVDKTINFPIGRSQIGMPGGSGQYGSLSLSSSQCVNSVRKTNNKEEDSQMGNNRSDTAGGESKSSASLDENGNPVVVSGSCGLVGGQSSSQTTQQQQQSQRSTTTNSLSTQRKPPVMPSSLKDATRFDRLKARNDKKKAYREKDIVLVEQTPGFRGDQDINDIIKYIEAEGDESTVTTRTKRKHNKSKKEEEKGRKDEDKGRKDEEVEVSIGKKGKNKCMDKDKDEQSGKDVSSLASENNRKNNNNKDEDRKSGSNNNNSNSNTVKKGKNSNIPTKKSGKKSGSGGGEMRESGSMYHSMEELASIGRLNDGRPEIRKQVTVDDGEMSSLNKQKDKMNRPTDLGRNILPDSEYSEGGEHSKIESDNRTQTSEFAADFYSVGDKFLSGDNPLSPSSPGGGDFEVVSSKKRGKRSRTGYTQNSTGRLSDQERYNTYGEDNCRFSRFNHLRGQRHGERPHISFSEGPRTPHEGNFLAQWSQLGVGERYGGERYGAQATTSAPHSEDSASDGDDSVHSMPVPSITPRPDVRKPPPSSDSTPQASYANIAKLAASANRAQMKRMSPAITSPRDQEGESGVSVDASIDLYHLDTPKLPPLAETRPANILDDNFPSLAESLGVIPNSTTAKSPEPSLVKPLDASLAKQGDASSVKPGETRTGNSENGVNETGASLNPRSDSNTQTDAPMDGVNKTEPKPDNLQQQQQQQHPPAVHHHHHHYKHHLNTPPPPITSTLPFHHHHHHPPPPVLTRPPPPLPHNYAIPPPTMLRHPPNAFTTQPPPQFTTPPPLPPPHSRPMVVPNRDNSSQTKPPPQPDATNGLPPEERHGKNTAKCRKNGVGPRKLEPAVVFTDNARFHQTVEGIEFGFGPDQPIATTDAPDSPTPDTNSPRIDTNSPRIDTNSPRIDTNSPHIDSNSPRIDTNSPRIDTNSPRIDTNSPRIDTNSPRIDTHSPRIDTNSPKHIDLDSNCNNNNNSANNNHNKNNSMIQKNDFCKWFQAPKNDKISYNYEELIRHFSKTWEVTLQQMEKDPKNIQYWQAAAGSSSSSGNSSSGNSSSGNSSSSSGGGGGSGGNEEA